MSNSQDTINGFAIYDRQLVQDDLTNGLKVAVFTVGMSGCGKTTAVHAQANLIEDSLHENLASFTQGQVSRDDARDHISNGSYSKGSGQNKGWKYNRKNEDKVTEHCRAAILDLVTFSTNGLLVWIDDTHLNPKFRNEYAAWLKSEGFDKLYAIDMRGVSYEVCVQRIAARAADGGRGVPKNVLKRQYSQIDPDYFKDYRLKNIEAGKPFGIPFDDRKKSVYIVDIDGTIAIMHNRSPFDESKVENDYLNDPVVSIIDHLYNAGQSILLVSGRSDNCRPETLRWLSKHSIQFDELHMRTDEEMQTGVKDVAVKTRILEEEILPRYNVIAVFDDRDQTVAGWRAHGLTCLQVAPGDF